MAEPRPTFESRYETYGTLAEMLSTGHFDDDPERKQSAVGMLNYFVDNELRKTDLTDAQIKTMPEALRHTYVTRAASDKAGRAIYGAQTAPRALSRAGLGAVESAFNAGLMTLDLMDAVLTPFGLEEGNLASGVQSVRDSLLASKKAAVAEAEDAHYEAYGQADTETRAFIDSATGLAGEAAPYMFLPAQWSTWTRTVLANAGIGGFAAGSVSAEQSDELIDKWGEMTTGAVLGMGISGLLNAKQAGSRFAARKINNLLETDEAKAILQLERQIQELTGQPDFHFSLGAITQNPFVVGLEVGAAKGVQRAAQVRRLNILRSSLVMRANELRNQGRSPMEIVHDLKLTAEEIMGGMRQQANANFESGINNVINTWPDDAVVKGDTYLAELQNAIYDLEKGRRGGSPGQVPAALRLQEAELQQYITPFKVVEREVKLPSGDKKKVWDLVDQREVELRKVGERPRLGELSMVERFDDQRSAFDRARVRNDTEGGLNAEQTRDFLNSFRRMSSGETPLWDSAQPGAGQALGRRLKGAFLQELEVGTMHQDAVNSVRALRQVYHTDRLMRQEVGRKLVTDLIGQNRQMNEAEILELISHRSRQDMESFRDLLKVTDPDLLDEIRSVELRRVANESKNVTGMQSLGDTDAYAMADALVGKDKDAIAIGLWDVEDQTSLRRLGRALQVMRETHLNLFPEASAGLVAEAGINVTSRDPGFVARFLLRMGLMNDGLSRLLNDPAARNSVIALANSKIGTPQYQYGAAALALFVGELEAETIRDAEAARREEERQIDMRLAP